jgi:hypothetical protein
MSEDELVEAYTSGRLPRRAFIRRLVARGVPLTAAIAYASSLAPAGGPSWLPPALRSASVRAAAGSPILHAP